MDACAFGDDATESDEAVVEFGVIEDAAIGDEGLFHDCAVEFAGGEEARAGEDGGGHIEEVEAGQDFGESDIGIEEGADGADILPVALEDMGIDAVGFDGGGDDVFAEVGEGVVEELYHDLAVEDVDAHGGEEQFVIGLDAEAGVPVPFEGEGILDFGFLGFFDEAVDAVIGIHLHDTEAGDIATGYGGGGDCDVGFVGDVVVNDCAVIHPVELIPAEDEHIFERMVHEVVEVFADGVGSALVPGGIGEGLFGGEDFNEAIGELVELEGLGDVSMEGGGVELGEEVDAFEAGVDAIGDGDIDESIFTGERDGGFGAVFGEGEESGALAAAEDDGEDGIGAYGFDCGEGGHRVIGCGDLLVKIVAGLGVAQALGGLMRVWA